jgi:hypothetical protein
MLVLHHCNKTLEIINLKEKKVYFGSWFQRFSPLGLHHLGLGWRGWWSKAIYLMGSQRVGGEGEGEREGKGEREREEGGNRLGMPNMPFKDTSLMT